jgi:hypothetical protein
MAKIHFRPYNPNQTVLFPQRIDILYHTSGRTDYQFDTEDTAFVGMILLHKYSIPACSCFQNIYALNTKHICFEIESYMFRIAFHDFFLPS